MRGEYKVPGGKLVAVELDVEADRLSNVRVSGDFFLEPDTALEEINAALAGMPAGVYEGQVGGKVELHSSGRLTMYGSDYLAGSASSLLDGINNAIRVSGLDVTEVVRYVTDVPATLLGLPPSDARVELAAAGGAFKVTGVTGQA